MDFKEGFKEVGKAIINVGVGTVLFAIVQPFVKGEFSTTLGITAFFTFILFLLIGFFLISAGVIKMTIEEYLVFLMVGISIYAFLLYKFARWYEKKHKKA